MNTLLKLSAVVVVLACKLAFAQDGGTVAPPQAPAPEEVKKVIEYYWYGKDMGPVLVEFQLCSKIDTDKNSPTHMSCLAPVKDKTKKGSLMAWTWWMVPKGGKYEDVKVQLLFGNEVRETKDITLSDSVRSRDFKSLTLSKAGKWTVKVLRGDKELAKADVTVTD